MAVCEWLLPLLTHCKKSFILVCVSFAVCMISYSCALEEGDIVDYNPTGPPELQFCTFFNNRAPEIQPYLRNCMWFQENSCCRQIEIDVTFRKMKPLREASEQCQRYINYLKCYICAPYQHRFYKFQQLNVCEEFCDTILQHCRTAMLKGSKLGDIYSSGTDFCESRHLSVQRLESGRCFYFNESMDTTLSSTAGPQVIPSGIVNLVSLSVLVGVNSVWR